MKTLQLEVARKCKEIRIKKRVSLKDFADYVGLKVETIKDMEAGAIAIPNQILLIYKEMMK